MILITAVYANTPGSRFDSRYYLGAHAKRAEAMLRPHGLLGIRVTLGVSDLADGPPPFWAVSEMTFESRSAFATAMEARGAELMQDAQNYTDVEPVLQFSELASPSTGP